MKKIFLAVCTLLISQFVNAEVAKDFDKSVLVERSYNSEGGRATPFTLVIGASTSVNIYGTDLFLTTNTWNPRAHRVTTLAHTENFCIYAGTFADWTFANTHWAVLAPSATFTTIRSHGRLYLRKQPHSSSSTIHLWIEEAAE